MRNNRSLNLSIVNADNFWVLRWQFYFYTEPYLQSICYRRLLRYLHGQVQLCERAVDLRYQ